MDIQDYLQRLKDRYEDRVSLKYDGSRRREMVELKSAMVNALSTVVHIVDVAKLYACDRTTVLHLCGQHESYFMNSKSYRHQYYIALELVNESLMQLPPGIEFGRIGRGDIVQQVKQINQTITFLNEVKDVIKNNGRHNQIYLSGDTGASD